ncbi:hypothetical protein [Chryseobacterium luquanense]|uniref:Uncharacterized protein n=1 Tax=Chryseobacterium luquanense TaxID=2983766 RepID=A0ABT3Y4J6_9FLAO|nr:hypothetical protein [Chryseobacterium luquanense]MCX8533066.1 hypothetical protein [Chryseobacterium luquanense]
MKKYLTRISQVYSAKNKLERSIQGFIKNNDRLLIDEKDLNQFKAQVIQHINFLNQEFQKCTPKSPSWFHCGETKQRKDWSISGIDCIVFYVHEVKSEYEITKLDN